MKVSVVLCTYNGEKYIKDLLLSLINQSQPLDELIVSDDGSIDNTLSIVKKYKSNFNKVTILANRDSKGAAKNFVDASLYATGDVIFFCDQDDIWLPTKIECMTNIMEKDKTINLLSSSIKPIYEKKPSFKNRFVIEKQKDNKRLEKVECVAKNINIKRSGWSMCVRNSFYKSIYKYWVDGWYHDDFVWKFSVFDNSSAIYNQVTVLRRIHDNNSSININRSLEQRLKQIDNEIKYSIIASSNLAHSNFDLDELEKFVVFQQNRKKYLENKDFLLLIKSCLFNMKCFRTKGQMFLDMCLVFGVINGKECI